MTRALFVDLVDTLITTKSGRRYPVHSEDWKFNDSILDCIQHYHSIGYLVIIISNENSIAEGYVNERVFLNKINTICTAIEKYLKLDGGTIKYVYCADGKGYNVQPLPGMAYEMAIEHELDLKNSIMVGDKIADRTFSINSGIGEFLNVNEVNAVEWKTI